MTPPNFSDKNITTKSLKLLDQVRDKLRVKDCSFRAEQSYVDWIKRFIFLRGKHPQRLGGVPCPPHRISCATLSPRICSATRMSDVSTAMIYAHVLNKGGRRVASPLDR